jgi:hypothetical protein
MKPRYLCQQHAHEFCQNLHKADRFWEQAMSSGMEAVNCQNFTQAQYCFGAAYEAATIILDHQLSGTITAENASNTLLAAQYLATALVQQYREHEAREVLVQLHKKLTFLCRNPQVNEALRQLLCDCLIPYAEKLHGIVLEQLDDGKAGDYERSKPDRFWVQASSCYH